MGHESESPRKIWPNTQNRRRQADAGLELWLIAQERQQSPTISQVTFSPCESSRQVVMHSHATVKAMKLMQPVLLKHSVQSTIFLKYAKRVLDSSLCSYRRFLPSIRTITHQYHEETAIKRTRPNQVTRETVRGCSHKSRKATVPPPRQQEYR